MQDDRVKAFQNCIGEAEAALLAKNMEEVEITSRDGLQLVDHWYPCENAKCIIVAMHGWRSAWHKDFGMVADFWHNKGCSILFAEHRGQNNSGGGYMTFGYMERFDCLDWINRVNKRVLGGAEEDKDLKLLDLVAPLFVKTVCKCFEAALRGLAYMRGKLSESMRI